MVAACSIRTWLAYGTQEEEVNEEMTEEVVEDEGGGGSRCWKEEKA